MLSRGRMTVLCSVRATAPMALAIAQASKWLSPKRAGGGDRASGVDSRTTCPGAVSRTTARVPGEASRFRDAAVAECASW